MDTLATSCANWKSYPSNLVRASDFPYITESYISQLDENEDLVFRPERGKVLLSDLIRSNDGIYEYPGCQMIEGDDDLKNRLSLDKPDPRRRFCFIQSKSSRDALLCSRAQLCMLLSRQQVMPAFLDFVFTFEPRENPHNLTSFQYEDKLSPLNQEPATEALQKSGVRIQHCFNILGIECDEKDTDLWKQRQVAAYHSFDVHNGNAFWIILKGNATVQHRMKQAADASLKRNPLFPKSISGSLQQALQEHLLILKWGTENWAPYLDSLEESCGRHTKITRYPEIQQLVDDTPIRRVRRWNTGTIPQITPIKKRSSTLNSFGRQALHFIEPGMRRASRAIPRLQRGDTGLSAQTQKMKLNDDQLVLDDLVSFKGLQSLNAIIVDLYAAASVIDQNKSVITDVRDRYLELGASALFEMHLEGEELKRCQDAINEFVRQTRLFESRLNSFQGLLRVILQRAEQGREMYNHIFQARNTRVAEFMGLAAQASAESMQECTEQMHLKTISMHLITVFTLIFLPGTFVATIFSSGIITFGDDGSSGFGPNIGDWKVREAGIKLFFIICLPMLSCTLGLWCLAYTSARVRLFMGRFFKSGIPHELPK